MDIPAEIEHRNDRLEIICAARERLEACQREFDVARARAEGDKRIPRDKDGKPKGGANRYGQDFGVPDDSARDNFIDPKSHIMKTAGGGFVQCYNGHTAVDVHANIIIAAGRSNISADNDRLPVLLTVVKKNCGSMCKWRWPTQAFAAKKYLRNWPITRPKSSSRSGARDVPL